MGAAFGWGFVAASSLVLGMILGLARSWPTRLIGLVLAFGAGALVSAVSFELFEEGVAAGGAAAVGIGLGLGALAYFVLARAVERLGPARTGSDGGGWGTRTRTETARLQRPAGCRLPHPPPLHLPA